MAKTAKAKAAAKKTTKAKVIAEPKTPSPEPIGDVPFVTPEEFAAAVVSTDEEPPPPPRIPHPDEGPVMPKYVPTYSPYGDQGDYAADHRLDKDLFVMIHGSRYEHVSETPDGRWVYRKA